MIASRSARAIRIVLAVTGFAGLIVVAVVTGGEMEPMFLQAFPAGFGYYLLDSFLARRDVAVSGSIVKPGDGLWEFTTVGLGILSTGGALYRAAMAVLEAGR